MQNGNKNFFEKEIQKLKLEKNKVEEDKRRIEGEKRKLETELSNMKTGQYGKPMPNFSGGHQEWFKAGISDRKKVPWLNHNESSKLQEELESMKGINKILSEDNQAMSDRLQ